VLIADVVLNNFFDLSIYIITLEFYNLSLFDQCAGTIMQNKLVKINWV
jgi:hypothetical protein